MNYHKKILAKVLLLVISLVFSLVLAELICALYYPSPEVKKDLLGREWNPVKNGKFPKYQTVYHDDLPYSDLSPSQRGKTSFYDEFSFDWEIDSFGLRSSEKIDTNNIDEIRILVLGDSQTFGYVSQESTFCSQLEKLLSSNVRNRHIRVLNGGVPGYCQFDELWKLTRLADVIRPQIVIVVAFIDNWLIPSGGNDLYGNYLCYHKIIRNEEINNESKNESNSTISSFLGNYLHIARPIALLKNRLFGKPEYSLDNIKQYSLSRSGDEELKQAWAITTELFEKIRRNDQILAHAQTIILYLPSIESLKLNDDSPYVKLKMSGIPVINAFSSLYYAGKDHDFSNLCYKRDIHYNAEAHRLIAKVIQEHLLLNRSF